MVFWMCGLKVIRNGRKLEVQEMCLLIIVDILITAVVVNVLGVSLIG